MTVPGDMVFNLLETETETIAEFSFSATDNIAVTVGPTCTVESGSTFQIGSTTVTCTAADAAGNVGTASFIVTVVEYDSTPPTVTVPSDITIYEIASNVGGVATFSVSAEDNVAVTVGPTCTQISGATFSVGDNTVTCTAEDANGNVGTNTFIVIVVEYTPPSLTISNARILDANVNQKSIVLIDQQVLIAIDVTNDQTVDQHFAYCIPELPNNNNPALGQCTTGNLTGGQSMIPALSWTPQFAGDYTFTIKLVDTIEDQNLLSTPITLQINIPEAVETESEVVTPSDEITPGSEIQIKTNIVNQQGGSQLFAYIVQIRDESGTTISFSTITGSLAQGQTLTQTISWTPIESGVYVAEIFLWDNLQSPNPLSSVEFQYFTVTG